MKQQFRLVHTLARQRAVQAIIQAPDGYHVIVREPTRSLEQNAKLHAMCRDISQQCQYLGRTLSTQQWKVLFVSAHAIATGQGADMIPGLEGEFVNIRESTADMTVSRKSSLIEYIHAWAAGQDVRFGDDAR